MADITYLLELCNNNEIIAKKLLKSMQVELPLLYKHYLQSSLNKENKAAALFVHKSLNTFYMLNINSIIVLKL